MSGEFAGLSAGFRHAYERIGAAQSAVSIARDRHDDALQAIAAVTDGSDSPLITATLENIAAADAALEGVLAQYQGARDNIMAYLEARGL